MKKSSPGFTLVELMVTITVSALVLACAVTFVLLGVRMENRSTETASQQRTVRIMLTMMEKLAAEGTIGSIKTVDEGWTLYTAGEQPLLQYLPSEGTLRYGDAVMLSNLEDADASISSEGNLFTVSLKTNGKEYKTSVFCRAGGIADEEKKVENIIGDAEEQNQLDFGATQAGRLAFLNALSGQYGSLGEIKNSEGSPGYFSEWYIGGYENDPRWNRETPWCGCFLSWGAAQDAVKSHLSSVPRFANVDEGMETFQAALRWHPRLGPDDVIYQPIPGDIIFFSWDGDNNPEHAGAVLYVSDDGNTVYTIEGNSNGKVAVNSYLKNSEYIIGYGVLDWKTQAGQTNTDGQ